MPANRAANADQENPINRPPLSASAKNLPDALAFSTREIITKAGGKQSPVGLSGLFALISAPKKRTQACRKRENQA